MSETITEANRPTEATRPTEVTGAAARLEPREPATTQAPEALVQDDLLIEDVSIDGMCGVY